MWNNEPVEGLKSEVPNVQLTRVWRWEKLFILPSDRNTGNVSRSHFPLSRSWSASHKGSIEIEINHFFKGFFLLDKLKEAPQAFSKTEGTLRLNCTSWLSCRSIRLGDLCDTQKAWTTFSTFVDMFKSQFELMGIKHIFLRSNPSLSKVFQSEK